MPTTKNKAIMIIIPLLIVIICLLLWYDTLSRNYTSSYSENSVWDLRELSFSNENYRLDGPVEYIPNALLTPEEFAARENEAIVGYPQDVSQYATSRIRIMLPDDGYYTFFCRSIDYSHRLYVDGQWILDVGSPGETKETTIPNTGKITLTLRSEDGIIEIIQQSSNFVHREGGSHAGWRVGTPELMRTSLSGDFRENIQLGYFLALFFIHILLFLLLRTYRANLYFSLFCLIWFLRIGVTGSKIFTILFPWMPWVVKFRIEYLAFPLTAVLLVSLLDFLFPAILAKWFRYALYSVSALIAMLFLFTDTVVMSHVLLWCEALYIPAILYIVVCFIMKLRTVKPEQCIFLIGFGLFFYAAVHDMFYYNDIILFPTGDLSSVSMLLLSSCAASAVFLATVHEMEIAKAKEQRLAVENAALDRMNRMRQNIMATVSHELRTPLTVMSVYAQLAMETLKESDVDPQTTADLSMISNEAKRLADMASGFLILTTKQEYQKTHALIHMETVITQMARLCEPMLTKNKNLLELSVPEGLPAISGNAAECTQLFWNLLDNASRFTHNGIIKISAMFQEGNISVTVSDTGEGIPAELLPHVFEQSVTGKEDGTGLGLAICSEIVSAHGGEISMKSLLGEGTSITFTLPAAMEDNHES